MRNTIWKLPGGYPDTNGIWQREIELRALTGKEEEILASKMAPSGGALVTEVITCCLQRIGPIRLISRELVRQLLVADRQFIIMKLRQITFGDRVQATVQCPHPGCGSKIDIDFSLKDVPVTELQQEGPLYSLELSLPAALTTPHGEVYREITFRLPNGEDQELVSPMVAKNEALALSMLLERCIQKVGSVQNPEQELIAQLSPLARFEIEKAMAAVAPRLDFTLAAICPECSRELEIPFNLQDTFFGEFRPSLDSLYREVHYLAYHYHWSEPEIMAMTRQKRWKYIEVLTEELEKMNYGD